MPVTNRKSNNAPQRQTTRSRLRGQASHGEPDQRRWLPGHRGRPPARPGSRDTSQLPRVGAEQQSPDRERTHRAEQAAKRYQLSTKLYAENDVELTHAECTLLQERIAAIYDSPLIQGRIADMLEGRK